MNYKSKIKGAFFVALLVSGSEETQSNTFKSTWAACGSHYGDITAERQFTKKHKVALYSGKPCTAATRNEAFKACKDQFAPMSIMLFQTRKRWECRYYGW